jgi:hypothetical protein
MEGLSRLFFTASISGRNAAQTTVLQNRTKESSLHQDTTATDFTTMAAPPPTEELPVREAEKKSSTEQEINPWDVQAGQDEQGNTLQFDYVAISQYAFPSLSHNSI